MTYFADEDAKSRMVFYDDLISIRLHRYTDVFFRLIFEMRGSVEASIMLSDKTPLTAKHKEILADYLKYKRTPKQAPLEQLAQSHAALASCAARFLDEIEMVPGVPGGASEAAVERCKKRARGEEEDE